MHAEAEKINAMQYVCGILFRRGCGVKSDKYILLLLLLLLQITSISNY